MEEVRQAILSAVPKRPEFYGYQMRTEDLYQACLRAGEELVGFDISKYAQWSSSDKYDFEIYFDEYSWPEDCHHELDKMREVFGDLDEYYHVTEKLLQKALGVDTWVMGRLFTDDEYYVDVLIGMPQEGSK